ANCGAHHAQWRLLMVDETTNTQPDAGGENDVAPSQKPAADALSLRGPNRKATRFKPGMIRMLVLGGVVLLALAFLYALSNSPSHTSKKKDQEAISDTRAVAEGLQALPTDYSQVKSPAAVKNDEHSPSDKAADT